MNITEIKIRKLYDEEKLKAIVSIILDDKIALHDIKIIQGKERKFIAMPSRREVNGSFRDIVHPINNSVREELEEKILNVYEQEIIKQNQSIIEQTV